MVRRCGWLGDIQSYEYVVCFFLGLPVQVRDEALNIHSEAPNSDVNRQYYAQNIAGKVSIMGGNVLFHVASLTF